MKVKLKSNWREIADKVRESRAMLKKPHCGNSEFLAKHLMKHFKTLDFEAGLIRTDEDGDCVLEGNVYIYKECLMEKS